MTTNINIESDFRISSILHTFTATLLFSFSLANAVIFFELQ